MDWPQIHKTPADEKQMTGETITSSVTDLDSPLETGPAGQAALNSLQLFRLVKARVSMFAELLLGSGGRLSPQGQPHQHHKYPTSSEHDRPLSGWKNHPRHAEHAQWSPSKRYRIIWYI